MGLKELRDSLRYDPPILPDLIWLLYNSVGRAAGAAVDSNNRPLLQDWINELQKYVTANGKFTKFEIAYSPVSPPPAFWDYKCRKCRWWIDPDQCQEVEGAIAPRGWCSVWLPPDSYKPFTWPKELVTGNW